MTQLTEKIAALVVCRLRGRDPHLGRRWECTENQLISAFADKFAELIPHLLTFNGNSFDLPVLLIER